MIEGTNTNCSSRVVELLHSYPTKVLMTLNGQDLTQPHALENCKEFLNTLYVEDSCGVALCLDSPIHYYELDN
jgi:hypothetical protein